MSYASLLTLLAGLAFTLPFLVRLAERAGVARSSSIVVTLALIIVLLSYAWLRWYLRDQDVEVVTGLEPGVLPSEPFVPDFFFQDGVFQGERLLAEGHFEAALKMFEAYRSVLARQGRSTGEVDEKISALNAIVGTSLEDANREARRESLQGTG